MQDLEFFWISTTCGQLVQGQKSIVVDSDQAVEEACEVLAKNGISSAPVYDKAKDEFVGMFDYGDIVTFLLAVMGKEEIPEYDIELKDIIQKGLKMGPVAVRMISDLSLRNPFVSLLPEATLLDALQYFVQGVHRVAIINLDGQLLGVLTQSAVIKFIEEKIEALGNLQECTLENLRLIHRREIISVFSGSSVLDALVLMHKHGISSIAVINESRQLTNVLSMSDIKFVFKNRLFSALWKTCSAFMAAIRNQQSLEENQGRDYLPVFQIPRTSTLRLAIQKLNAVRAHRLWVTDDGNHPLSVITMTDIIQVLNPKIKESSYIS